MFHWNLVQDEDLGLHDEGAGDGEALLLAPAELVVVGPDDGVEARREAEDEVVRAGLLGRLHDLRLRRAGPPELEVVQHGHGEQLHFLGSGPSA